MNGREPLAELLRNSVAERLAVDRELLVESHGFRNVRPETTVAEAVLVLNQRKHRGYSDWKTSRALVLGVYETIAYTHFDAIAIAEKYQRDA